MRHAVVLQGRQASLSAGTNLPPEFVLFHNKITVVPVSHDKKIIFWSILDFTEISLKWVASVFYDPGNVLKGYYKRRVLDEIIAKHKITWSEDVFMILRENDRYYLEKDGEILARLRNYRSKLWESRMKKRLSNR